MDKTFDSEEKSTGKTKSLLDKTRDSSNLPPQWAIVTNCFSAFTDDFTVEVNGTPVATGSGVRKLEPDFFHHQPSAERIKQVLREKREADKRDRENLDARWKQKSELAAAEALARF